MKTETPPFISRPIRLPSTSIRTLPGEPLQMAVDHLSNCEECVLAVDDLRAFRNEIAPSLDREYRPASVPVTTEPTNIGWREKFVSLFRVSPVPAFGSAALALVVLGVIFWLVVALAARTRTDNRECAYSRDAAISVNATIPSAVATRTATPAPIIAQLNDGDRVLALDQQGKLSGADHLPRAYQTLVTKALSIAKDRKISCVRGTHAGAKLVDGFGCGRPFFQ